MNQPFANTTAVVTGASSGIGRAIAVALGRAGVNRMLVHYRTNEAGARETSDLLGELGCEANIFAADLSRQGDASKLVDAAWKQLGTIQTWVNNAGADVLTGAAASMDFDAKLRKLMDVDVIGTIQLSRLVAQRLLGQLAEPPPSMVFIGWDQANEGMEGDAGQLFAPTKAAVTAFAASLAQTLAPDVRVNTIAPGWIQTAWGDSASEYWDRRAEQQSLMRRWGRPEDVAAAVRYAADPSNTFLTGQTLQINGGWNRRFST